MSRPTVLEICAGGGGQSLGLESAGFSHVLALDNDNDACNTLKMNRPGWTVVEDDIRSFTGAGLSGVDLLAGGVPCPPFSIAGKQLGGNDERDLFPEAIRLINALKPRAVLLENVRGLATAKFNAYRDSVLNQLRDLGYASDWRLLNASEFGVPQLRPRFVLVALLAEFGRKFQWPTPAEQPPPTVGRCLRDLMAARGWGGAATWAMRASAIAPTIVGGSKKHGGPDLGPTRARESWRLLDVDGTGIADYPPGPDFPADGIPKLTLRMVARLQGFPDDWSFSGAKTAAYRQVGNAFPPPVAARIASAIHTVLVPGSAESAKPESASVLPLGAAVTLHTASV